MDSVEPSLLRLPGFLRFASSALLNTIAFSGEQVVLGWLVLDLTNSPLLVGVALALRMAPLLLIGLPAGVLADRGDRIVLLRGANTTMALALTLLGTLTVLGRVTVESILAITFFVGCARALQQVTQQTHAHDLVGPARLTHALGALGIAQRLPTSVWEGLASFFQAARAERRLPALMALTAAGEVLGFSHQAVLPSLARDILHVGPEGLGAMSAARQAGGIVAMLCVGRLSQLGGLTSVFVTALGVFGVGVAALGLAPGYGSVLLVLTMVNAVGATCDVLGQSLMQQAVPPHLRGRASGAWVVAIGVGPVGQFQIGALVSWLGVAAALAMSGAALVAVAVGVRLMMVRARRA